MSISPPDRTLLSALLGDDEIAPYLSDKAEIAEMIRFEAALAIAEGAEGIIPVESASHIARCLETFVPSLDELRMATARDGVVGVDFVRQLREHVGPPHAQFVHFGATSQDLVDTALLLRLKPVLAILAERTRQLIAVLTDFDKRFGMNEIVARTRMQDALPIAVAHRLAAWQAPLPRHLDRLNELSPRLLLLQFGGAVGTLDKLGDRARPVAARLATALGLGVPERSWHSQRDSIVELADWLSLVSGSLGKIGVDVVLMAQNAVDEIALEGGGGSSAMPHKQNPVGAEVLVALARYNATLVGGMHEALLHEQERSGAAWTLEWLILPQMVTNTAASLRTTLALCGRIVRIGRDH